VEDERLIQYFSKIDEQFEKIDERFEKIDERFEKIDERFDEMNERFREAAMRSDRIEGELKFTNLKLDVLTGRVDRLTDEIKLPSGIVGQRFAELREEMRGGDRQTRVLIEKLDFKVMSVGEQVDLVNGKLDRFRAELEGR